MFFCLRFWVLPLLPMLVYVNSLPNSFHYDDLHTIVNNSALRSNSLAEVLKKLPVFFTSSEYYSAETHQVSHYRPLLYASFLINESITGLDPVGFRWLNLALHIGCVFAVYSLGRRLFENERPAFLAGLIFGIHPLFSEGINYISARSSLLATFFYLLAFLFFIRYREETTNPTHGRSSFKQWICLSGMGLLGTSAFLSKEISITLPVIFGLYDLLFTRKKRSRRWLSLALPYLLIFPPLLFVLAAIDLKVYLGSLFSSSGLVESGFLTALVQVKGWALTPVLFIAPIELTVDHAIARPESFWDPVLVGALILLTGLLGIALWFWRSRPSAAFLSLWFIVTALPTTLIPLNIPMMEHREYLPGVALAMGLGYLSPQWLGQKAPFYKVAMLALLILIYGGITVQRNTIWKNEVTLWTDAVNKAPVSERAWTNLGLAYQGRQEIKAALFAYQRALSINSNAPVAHVGIGSIYHIQGNLEAAVTAYKKAVSLYPHYYLPYFNLGVAYQQMGRLEDARKAYLQALEINAHSPPTHMNLGNIYLAEGNVNRAAEEYRRAIQLDPSLVDAHYNLAVAYQRMEQADLAQRHYEEAQRLSRR